MMLRVIVPGRVLVIVSGLVHPVMQLAMGCGQHELHALVRPGLGARADGIEIRARGGLRHGLRRARRRELRPGRGHSESTGVASWGW